MGVEPGGSAELLAVRQALGRLTDSELPPDAMVFDAIEARFFELAPLAAACGDLAEGYASLQMFLRDVIKDQSRHWDMGRAAARERSYRLLYGSTPPHSGRECGRADRTARGTVAQAPRGPSGCVRPP